MATTPEGVLTEYLIADPAVSALIGSNIYVGKLPKGITDPWVRQTNVSEKDDAHATTGSLRAQYSVFGSSLSQCRKVARAIRKSGSGLRGIQDGIKIRRITHIITNELIPEDDTAKFEVAVDFRINYSLID